MILSLDMALATILPSAVALALVFLQLCLVVNAIAMTSLYKPYSSEVHLSN